MPKKYQNKGTGLLVLEVRNSGINNDPDNGGEPRVRATNGRDYGEVTDKSVKRKFRDLVLYKEGPVWQHLQESMKLDPERFQISEDPTRNRQEFKKMSADEIIDKFWDVRVFGTTLLDEKATREEGAENKSHTQTGPFVFGEGISVAPVQVSHLCITKRAPVESDKSRGMGRVAYIQHGLFTVPMFFNPTNAEKTRCSEEDIEILKRLMPYIYQHTSSTARPCVNVLRAWYVEHKNPLGSCQEFRIIDALTPTKKHDPLEASENLADYSIPDDLPQDLKERVTKVSDYSSPEL